MYRKIMYMPNVYHLKINHVNKLYHAVFENLLGIAVFHKSNTCSLEISSFCCFTS